MLSGGGSASLLLYKIEALCYEYEVYNPGNDTVTEVINVYRIAQRIGQILHEASMPIYRFIDYFRPTLASLFPPQLFSILNASG
jgi:hypothetical protein